jgi:hypothetical protein
MLVIPFEENRRITQPCYSEFRDKKQVNMDNMLRVLEKL